MGKAWVSVGVTIAVAVEIAMATPGQAQRLPPDQMVRKHLEQTSTSMMSVLPKVAAYGSLGQTISDSGWKVLKTGETTAVGSHKATGLIAVFEADPNQDKSTEDARFVVFQPFEYMCPNDIAGEPRLQGVKPHFDAIATALIQNGKTQISMESRVINFVAGSPLDILLCGQ